MDEETDGGSELKLAAEEAFPGGEWTEDRLAALKELISLCGSSDYEDEPSDKDGSHKDTLALLFGKPKK